MRSYSCFLTLFSIFLCSVCLSQNDSLRFEKRGLNTIFYQNFEPLQPHDLVSVTSGYEEAQQYMLKARSNHRWKNVFFITWIVGGGYAAGSYLFGEGSPGAIVFGGSTIIMQIACHSWYIKNARLGVQAYNSSLNEGPEKNNRSIEIGIGFVHTGVGVRIGFR